MPRCITKSRSDLPLLALNSLNRQQLSSSHQCQRSNHCNKRARINQKTGTDAEDSDDDATNGRPHDTASIHKDRIQADGVRQEITAHHLLNKCLASGHIEEVDDAKNKSEPVNDPDGWVPERHQEPEAKGQESSAGLRRDQQGSLGEAIDNGAAIGPGHENGEEGQRHHNAQIDRRAREFEDEPGLSDALHPRARNRDQLPDRIKPKITNSKRGEGPRCRRPHPTHRRMFALS